MIWTVHFHEAFAEELGTYDVAVVEALRAHIVPLQQFGPQLGRPHVDTLKGSKHTNMKELRFKAANGVWRVAFAFDPDRTAILLVAGDKSGVSESRFYEQLIGLADRRLDVHLKR